MSLLNGLSNVGCEPWCSRGPHRAPVAAILRWAATCTGEIGGLAWTCVGLHALHSRTVCTVLSCREGYRPGGLGWEKIQKIK